MGVSAWRFQPQATSYGRYYDPALGRFLQPDPVVPGTGSQSLNRFSYAFNNPLRFIDPDGHFAIFGEDDTGRPIRDDSWRPGRPQYSLTELYEQAGVEITIIGGLNTSHADPDFGTSQWYIKNYRRWNGDNGTYRTGNVIQGYEPGLVEQIYLDAAQEAATNNGTISNNGGRLAVFVVIAAEGRSSTGEILYRGPKGPESVSRLARKAAEAEAETGLHGVSVWNRPRYEDMASAPRDVVEQHFEVVNTGPPGHRTVVLPKPVTKGVADLFNWIFGR